ncbi:MAG: acetoacetate decarboxylase family protein, partial [Jatrophihabitantaceae bacterium]
WDLRGQLYTSVFLVPLAEIPVDLPPGCRPVSVGRYGIVGIAWVSYEPDGVLAYSELMSTLLVRRGLRLMPTITHIWVDNDISRDGGRRLWGIPKQLAKFAFSGVGPGTAMRVPAHFSASVDDGPIADGTVRTRLWLPGRWPLGFRLVQWLDGKAKVSPVSSRARLGIGRATFVADPTGPLAFLAGRRPLLSATVADFRMSFGQR